MQARQGQVQVQGPSMQIKMNAQKSITMKNPKVVWHVKRVEHKYYNRGRESWIQDTFKLDKRKSPNYMTKSTDSMLQAERSDVEFDNSDDLIQKTTVFKLPRP